MSLPSKTVDTKTGKVLAVGEEAYMMVGRTPANIRVIRPLKGGVIADFDITEAMLTHFIDRLNVKGFLTKPKFDLLSDKHHNNRTKSNHPSRRKERRQKCVSGRRKNRKLRLSKPDLTFFTRTEIWSSIWVAERVISRLVVGRHRNEQFNQNGR